VAWAGERRSPYREYGQAFRRTHDAKDPGPSGWVPAGARGVAALDRISRYALRAAPGGSPRRNPTLSVQSGPSLLSGAPARLPRPGGWA